jgi:hypothetical protein
MPLPQQAVEPHEGWPGLESQNRSTDRTTRCRVDEEADKGATTSHVTGVLRGWLLDTSGFRPEEAVFRGTICPFDTSNHRHCYRDIPTPCARIVEKKQMVTPKSTYGPSGHPLCTIAPSVLRMRASDRMTTEALPEGIHSPS